METSDVDHSVGAPGVLTRDDIKRWMEKPVLADRLVVTPLLNANELFGPSNLDVRLGNQFLVFKREDFDVLDVGAAEGADMTRFQQRIVKPLGKPFVLHPHQLVIGSTLEYMQIPPGLMCYVIGKSGWGRMGLVIATATKVDPGFRGCITLEIINEGEVPLILYAGLPIAQLVFHVTSSITSTYSGSYRCPTGPQFPKLSPPHPLWRFWTAAHRPTVATPIAPTDGRGPSA
jgi:dCTP deaminase